MIFQRWTSLRALVVLTAAVCLLLAALRITAETSFREPLHRQTSGCEEEALFSLWKVTQNQQVYADPFQIPYAISYFNWLFYATYGGVSALALNVMRWPAEWLPTVSRFLTLLLSAGCGFGFLKAAETGGLWPRQFTTATKISLAAIAAFSPLFGFYNFTARPDVGALFFELMGLILVFRYVRTKRPALLILATIVLFCAWSFKQTSVLVIGGVCLWFLFHRRYLEVLLISSISSALYLATFLSLGADYAYAVVKSQAHCAFQLSLGAENMIRAFVKSPLLPGALLFWTMAAFSRHARLKDETRTPLSFIFIFSFLWCVVLSMKEGSSDIYFFGPSMFGTLWLLGLWKAAEQAPRPSPLVERGFLIGLCLQFVAAALVLSGRSGVIKNEADQLRHRRLAEILDPLPGPVFVGERFGNLPWIQRKPPHFVYAYTYPFDRAAGKIYNHGGLGGLIERRYFHTIVLRNSAEPPDSPSFDGQNLAAYERIKSEAGYDFYVLSTDLGTTADPNPP
jgi:hypothetical protein